MLRRLYDHFSCATVLCWLVLAVGVALPQTLIAQASPDNDLSARLEKVTDSLEAKIERRNELTQLINGIPPDQMLEERAELVSLNDDIASLRSTFEILVIGDVDTSLFSASTDDTYDWRQELVDVMEPLLDSLKSLTRKPRQINDLRTTIALENERMRVANRAIEAVSAVDVATLDDDARDQVQALNEKWLSQKDNIDQRLLAATASLERLTATSEEGFTSFLPSVKEFMLGRGLTLLLAMTAAIATWMFTRFLWWVYSTHLTTKDQRRRSAWFRFLSYTFYLVSGLLSLFAVLVVLYLREDLLLMALAIILLAAAVLGIRQYIPGYIREARLLLNLGSVREDERIIYNDIPWQVMSLNIETVLRNPALDGILRLSLGEVSHMTSRPIKDNLWFPTKRGDYVIMPDSVFGQVMQQTPELVQLRVRAGMTQTYRAADFYSSSLVNLNGGDTFGVASTFGFDYGLQDISLDRIPSALYDAIEQALKDAGYRNEIENILVELKSAGESSLDYLIFLTIKSTAAKDYFRFDRIIQQTCVAVANREGWGIPFPQMVVHHQPL